MAFANLTAALNLDISNFSAKLTAASKSMTEFAAKANSDYGRGTEALKSHNLGLKDTLRIVQGIMVSQVFYGIAGQIREATSALWAFNEALDYAQVTYSALFGSRQLASDFLGALQEHSINTIFEFDTLAQASKKLLAYGIEYKNLMFIMEGLTNLGAMSGDTAALDRISYALGQIYAKGKLSAEEMRQLANAYVPIQEIIKEEFGLTEDQLGRVGDLNLPAEKVINAIVDYANEKFGSVGDAAMMTITGLKNRIVDTFKVLGVEMLAPVTAAFKSFLVYIATGLESIRNAYKSGGMGGVLEYLVPNKATQDAIRQVVANVKNLFMSLVSVLTVVGRVAGEAIGIIVTAFNLIAPVVVPVINTLSYFLNMLLQTRAGAIALRTALIVAAAAFLVLRIQAAGAMIVTAVTSAINGLSKALLVLSTIITKHPILAMLSLLAVGLVAVAANSEKAKKALSGLMGGVSGATGGTTAGDVLQKVEKDIHDNTTAADQFNQRLEEGKDAAEDLEDAINGVGNAGKKAAGLLAFDEVFKLNDTSEPGSGSGSGGVMGAIDDLIGSIDGLGGALGEGLIPEVPDFSEFAADFTDSMFGSLENALTDEMKSVGLGASIGSVLGGIIGAVLKGATGAKIGMAIGGLAGGIVAWLKEQLEIGFSGTLSGAFTGMAAAIAKAFGGSLKDLPYLFKNSGSLIAFFKNIGSAIKNTGLKSLLKSGVIGMAIGFVVDTIAALFFKWLADALKLHADAEGNAAIGSTIAGIIGGLIGMIWGPVGSLIGSAIGTFVGGFTGLLWEDAKVRLEEKIMSLAELLNIPVENAGKAWAGYLIGGFIGTLLSALHPAAARYTTAIVTICAEIGAAIGLFWDELTADIKEWMDVTFGGLANWFARTFGGFTTWVSDTWKALTDWLSFTYNIFTDFDSITGDTLGEWWSVTTEGFKTWAANTLTALWGWIKDTWNGFWQWADYTLGLFLDWVIKIGAVIALWIADTIGAFLKWAVDTLAIIGKWALDALIVIVIFVPKALFALGEFVGKGLKLFVGFGIAVVKAIDKWAAETLLAFANWAVDAKKKFDDWKKDTMATVSGWATDVANSWKKLWDPNTWKSGWSMIKGWFTDLFNDIKNWFSSLGTSVSSWWDGLWDGKSASVDVDGGKKSWFSLGGHAEGGIFDREHIARFAEGNKAEAVIPLENASAMQPFVDAISNGILQGLLPAMATNGGNSNGLPPMYVGTLVADERGLQQLFKKFEVYEAKELARKGLA